MHAHLCHAAVISNLRQEALPGCRAPDDGEDVAEQLRQAVRWCWPRITHAQLAAHFQVSMSVVERLPCSTNHRVAVRGHASAAEGL